MFEDLEQLMHAFEMSLQLSAVLDAHQAGLRAVPPLAASVDWFIGEFLLALVRYGHWDPYTGHVVPAGCELDALEKKEDARDLFNSAEPGLGDRLAAGEPFGDG